MRRIALATLVVALATCAGLDQQTLAAARDQQPVVTIPFQDQPAVTVQVQDRTASCTQIEAEILRNNLRVTQLAEENGWRIGQNSSPDIYGLYIWPVLFDVNFPATEDTEEAALQGRQQYLATLAAKRCAGSAPRQ